MSKIPAHKCTLRNAPAGRYAPADNGAFPGALRLRGFPASSTQRTDQRSGQRSGAAIAQTFAFSEDAALPLLGATAGILAVLTLAPFIGPAPVGPLSIHSEPLEMITIISATLMAPPLVIFAAGAIRKIQAGWRSAI